MNKKDLSVIVFAYNHENYIEQTILSVVHQKTKYSYEIVINDDCSTDGTYSVIQSLQSKYPELIKVIRNEINFGLNKSFENAVRNVSSIYIALLGGDDYFIVSDKIEKQLDILFADKTISFVHTSYKSLIEKTNKIVDGCNKDWKWPKESENPLDKAAVVLTGNWNGYPSASTSCFQRDILIKGLDELHWIIEFTVPGEGTIIHISMCLYGGKYHFITEDTVMYRIRSGSLSHKKTKLEQYRYTEAYALLRLKICDELQYPIAIKNQIIQKIVDALFIKSILFRKNHIFSNMVRGLELPTKYKNRILFKCNVSWWYYMFSYMKRVINRIVRFFK